MPFVAAPSASFVAFTDAQNSYTISTVNSTDGITKIADSQNSYTTKVYYGVVYRAPKVITFKKTT